MIRITLLLIVCYLTTFSQEKKGCDCPGSNKNKKGTLYIAWGYNRDAYSKSDIHFKSTTGLYDFTVFDVKAKDKSNFEALTRFESFKDYVGAMTIPQYNYRLGYYQNKTNWGIEINFDHAKYVVQQFQTVRIKGQIYGTQMDKDTILYPDFLRFEHTDGANFLMANIMKRHCLFTAKKQQLWAVAKAGIGTVIPKTDITLFGVRKDNCFHIAGWITGVETGLRYDFFSHYYFELTGKGVFADYRNVLVIGESRANHHFFAAEGILTFGFQFGL